MDIKMSLEDTKRLNGAICFQFINQNQKEFDEEDYLEERYTRAKTLKQLMKIQDPTEMEIVIAYEKFLTDVAIGYGFGKAPTYYNSQAKKVDKRKTVFGFEKPVETYYSWGDNDEEVKENDDFLLELQNLHRENRDHKEIIRFAKSCFIKRKAYELIYTNEDGDIRYKLLGGHGLLIKSDDIESKTIGFIRTYKTRKFNFLDSYDDSSMLYNDITVIELYTHFKRVKYTSEDNYKTEYNLYDNGAKPFEEDWEIPVVALEMPYNIGYFEQQIPEIRGLELVTNNTKKVLNYNDDAILLISGATFLDNEDDNVDEVVNMYRTKGVIFTGNPDEGGGAEWLTKNVNDQTNQAHKENLKNDIYGITGLFNPESDSAVYQNTLSLIFKLYGLETKMSEFEEIFKDAMRRRNKIIAQILNKRDNRNYDWKSIDMTMFRNLPSNTNEELNFVNQAREILPLEDLYEQLSFVTDAKEEVAKYEADQIRQAKLDAEIAKIMSEATANDMISDDPYANDMIIEDSNEDVENNDNDNVDNTESIFDNVV